jgi:hypothetical protein
MGEFLDFNHELNETAEACGLVTDKTEEKYDAFIESKGDGGDTFSVMVEQLVNNFSKRELAYIMIKMMVLEQLEAEDRKENDSEMLGFIEGLLQGQKN